MKLNQDNFVNKRKKVYSINTNKLYEKIQNSIFGVLYVLLKDDDSNMYLSFLLSFTEFLEFLQFPFNNCLIPLWDYSTIASEINNVIEYINIVHYLSGQSTLVYLCIFYFFVVSVSAVIANIFYVSYSFNRKYFTQTWPLIVLRNVAKTFVTILFMPILELFISIFVCNKNNDDGLYYNSIATDLICFRGAHFVHMFIALIISIVFFIICVIVAINFFECSEIGEDIEAK